MPKLALLNQAGQTVGEIELKDSVFAVEPNEQVIYDVVRAQRAAMRHGTHKTKTRAEVSGGGRKPYRQKGTGNARQGSITAPHYVGGGVAFGTTPRDYSMKLNKKVRRLAIKIALSEKVTENKFVVLDKLVFEEIKTKTMVEVLKNVNVQGKVLVVLPEHDEKIEISARNIEGVQTTVREHASVYEMLNSNFILTTEDVVKEFEEALE